MNTYNETQTVGLQVLNNLYQNSWNSPEFKERLINNPTATIEETVGHHISPDYRFVVEDQSDSSIIYLNIPAKKDIDSLELTDEQLESVSGGDFFLACAIVAGCCVLAAGVGVAVGYYANKK